MTLVDRTRPLFAELLGTFSLVFAGTGAIVVNDVTGGALGQVGIAATFGLVVLAAIAALGDVSGAHLNPAVTFGFSLAGRFPFRSAPGYWLAQLSGALLASLSLQFLYPSHASLGATLPTVSAPRALLVEGFLTFFLMFVILSVSTGGAEKGSLAAISISSTVGLEALFAGPITGASMNPARSFAPAVVSGRVSELPIYLAGPIVGAGLAVPACRLVRGPACCNGPASPTG